MKVPCLLSLRQLFQQDLQINHIEAAEHIEAGYVVDDGEHIDLNVEWNA